MRKVAIMQPYFFPYIGYFSLLKNTDTFILFDTPQYMRHGWIERNRVLKQGEGWVYIKAPLQKHSQLTLISEIYIDNTQEWQKKIFAQLEHYKKIAPYYKDVASVLHEVFEHDYETITDLNEVCLRLVCRYIGFEPVIKTFSKMKLVIDLPQAPDEWALNICKAIGDVDEYWNPPGGQEFFDPKKYEDNNILLKFQKAELVPYDQKRQLFEPGLSIIDVMMFNSPKEICSMLDKYELT